MPPYMYTDKQPCGTYPAYRRHLYHGEEPCLPCRQARAREAQQSYARKREAPAPRKADGHAAALAARIDAATRPGTVSRYLLDICEAVEGPPAEWLREARMEAL